MLVSLSLAVTRCLYEVRSYAFFRNESLWIALTGGNIQNIHFRFRLNIRNKSCPDRIHGIRITVPLNIANTKAYGEWKTAKLWSKAEGTKKTHNPKKSVLRFNYTSISTANVQTSIAFIVFFHYFWIFQFIHSMKQEIYEKLIIGYDQFFMFVNEKAPNAK